MTVINTLEHKNNEEGQLKACLVTEHRWLENIQSFLMDANLLVTFRERLLDLLKEHDCNLYIVDTAVKDINMWPAPLLADADAWFKRLVVSCF